jgi:hypothetical protein
VDVSRQTANRQDHDRENNPGFEFRDLEAVTEGVGDGTKHGAI